MYHNINMIHETAEKKQFSSMIFGIFVKEMYELYLRKLTNIQISSDPAIVNLLFQSCKVVKNIPNNKMNYLV